MAKRKFSVGDRAWRSGRRWVEYRVVGTVGRSYLIVKPGQDPSQAEKVSYQVAERDFRSDAEMELFRWHAGYRRVLISLIDRADVETLKLVANVLGWVPGKGTAGSEAKP